MAEQLSDELRELAEQQRGILTSQQLRRDGVSRNAINAKLRLGRWQRIHRGVYATFTGELGRLAVLWAAALSAGPGAVLSHQTAAELAGLSTRPSELIHVTVPSHRRVRRTQGIVIHISARAVDARHPAKLPPQTRIEETVLDLVDAARTIDVAGAWLTRALGSRLTTQAKLRHALELRAKIRWRSELSELLTSDSAGLHSILERRYQRDVERPHGLPRAARQVQFRSGDHNEYRDVLYEPYCTAIELDGDSAHAGGARWRDIQRDNAAAATGIVTLRYGWFDVTQTPCLVAAEVARVLAGQGFAGARPCSAGCPVGELSQQRRPPA